MKKSVSLTALGIFVGMTISAGVAVATAGAPSVGGIYGWFSGGPVYRVELQASSGLYVPGCPNGQTLTGTGMNSGGYTVYCK